MLIVAIISVAPPLILSLARLVINVARAYWIIKKANHDFYNRD